MNIAQALFAIAEHTLSIYDTKTSRKYLDEVIALRKAYYNEQNKPEESRNFAIMDNAINRLCIITEATSSFGKPSIKNWYRYT